MFSIGCLFFKQDAQRRRLADLCYRNDQVPVLRPFRECAPGDRLASRLIVSSQPPDVICALRQGRATAYFTVSASAGSCWLWWTSGPTLAATARATQNLRDLGWALICKMRGHRQGQHWATQGVVC